jgi:high-affinity Fe2+/Pb2+ permease
MERTIGIWISGVLASAIVGGWIGAFITRALSSSSIHEPIGIIGGICAFTCARLWLGEPKTKS